MATVTFEVECTLLYTVEDFEIDGATSRDAVRTMLKRGSGSSDLQTDVLTAVDYNFADDMLDWKISVEAVYDDDGEELPEYDGEDDDD